MHQLKAAGKDAVIPIETGSIIFIFLLLILSSFKSAFAVFTASPDKRTASMRDVHTALISLIINVDDDARVRPMKSERISAEKTYSKVLTVLIFFRFRTFGAYSVEYGLRGVNDKAVMTADMFIHACEVIAFEVDKFSA